MSAKSSKRISDSPKATAKRLAKLRDEDIDFSDIPMVGEEFLRTARLLMPQPKKSIALRLDADVLNWLRQQGRGYQSRINAILRAYMATERRRGHVKN